ncbi:MULTISPECIES: hypothetical protein [unclassified Limnospira]|uniref:hypothetical protein n=1 Tax=unclassified Limnospira TaxID=2642885 RepID=UPI0028E12731|nr:MULTISPECIES: hypothetical protein [unclassified Limnospira]MDT9280794.1 hypothetical protein [Limnospira sp. PMC 1293.21]MDT9316691.1 hypothetical protein [Limnospira sp. PMC 1306.21]
MATGGYAHFGNFVNPPSKRRQKTRASPANSRIRVRVMGGVGEARKCRFEAIAFYRKSATESL